MTAFLLLSILTMVGLGLGNIVLPPLIKRYFPDKVGVLTALYLTLFALITALTPQLAVPIAKDAGWRFSLGVWSVASAVAAVPWIIVLLRGRHARRFNGFAGDGRSTGTAAPGSGPGNHE